MYLIAQIILALFEDLKKRQKMYLSNNTHRRTLSELFFLGGLRVSDNAEPPTKPPPVAEEPCLKTEPVDHAKQPCGKHKSLSFSD